MRRRKSRLVPADHFFGSKKQRPKSYGKDELARSDHPIHLCANEGSLLCCKARTEAVLFQISWFEKTARSDFGHAVTELLLCCLFPLKPVGCLSFEFLDLPDTEWTC